MFTFPSISQFRHTVKSVQLKSTYRGRDEWDNPIYCDLSEVYLPTLLFHGTVKLHGTNAGVVRHPDGTISVQSRSRIITVKDDNHGFAQFVHTIPMEIWETLFRQIFGDQVDDRTCVIFGEWCGRGIMKGVGICNFDKLFVIFAAKTILDEDTSEWIALQDDTNKVNVAEEHRIFNVYHFPTFEIEIDFADPRASVKKLEALTSMVEDACPVTSGLGKTGFGEGIVWRCVTPGYESSRFWFKTKGDKHKVTKSKKKVSVDPEKAGSISEFVEKTVTEARCQQGIAHLTEMGHDISRRSTGHFLKWVGNDILKEEADTLQASGLTRKDVGGPISVAARKWLFKFIDDQVGL